MFRRERANGEVAGHVPIEQVRARAFTVPTDSPESDGTLAWEKTTLVVVQIRAGGKTSLGYTYADPSIVPLITQVLAPLLEGQDAFATARHATAMLQRVRNINQGGLAAMAISAADCSLWDLKARLLNAPLVTVLGAMRPSAPVYGSGGFTSYSLKQLEAQLAGWASQGIGRVKMKVGRAPGEDPQRVRAARDAIGPGVALFVDANGAYSVPQALQQAEAFARAGVTYFEEPVSSQDLTGLRTLVERAPPGMSIAAGEYGDSPVYFRRMLEANAVHILQADATRCLGFTGFLHADALCEAFERPLSAHCAPALHVHAACASRRLVHIEYFHDHVRLEQMLFDGVSTPVKGELFPDLSRPGLGLELKESDAARYEAKSATG